jgi:hypothetical protein
MGGKLVECPPLHQIHDGACYLSTKSNATLKGMHQLLHDWTVQAHCQGHVEANRSLGKWSDRPFFHFSRLVGELGGGYDPRLVMLGNQTKTKKGVEIPLFVIEQHGKDLWLALHPKVQIKVPFTCKIGRFIFGLVFLITTVLGIVLTATWSITSQLSILYYGAFMEAPLYVGFASIFLTGLSFAIYGRWVIRIKRDQRNLEVVNVREDVHKRLESAAGHEINVQWLCQDISWKRHEMSKQGRRNLEKHVWPHVVRDITEDGRIQKLVKTEQGKRMDYWKWTAPIAPSSANRSGTGALYSNSNGRNVRFDQ